MFCQRWLHSLTLIITQIHILSKRRKEDAQHLKYSTWIGYFHKHKLQLKYLPTLNSLILGNIFLSVLNISCVHCLSVSPPPPPPPPPGYFQKHKLQVKYLPMLNILIVGNTFLSVLNLSCILCLSATPPPCPPPPPPPPPLKMHSDETFTERWTVLQDSNHLTEFCTDKVHRLSKRHDHVLYPRIWVAPTYWQ